MRTLAHALFLSALSTAVFGGLLYALAPDALRHPGPMPEPEDFEGSVLRVYDDDGDDDLSDAQALALLRELKSQFG